MTTAPTTATEENTQNAPAEFDPAGVAIHVDHLSHTYPAPRARKERKGRNAKHDKPVAERAALHDISFTVQLGEVFGLLGPNGSGKSTLLRILATVQATSMDRAGGGIQVMGIDLLSDPAGVRRQIGVVFQSPSLDDKLTAMENMRYHGMLYGLNGAPLVERCRELLDAFELGGRADERVSSFSGGMRRRVEIAKALLPRPRLLLMDEAATGLDVAAQREMWAMLVGQAEQRGLTVVIATHLMDEAARCDRLAVLSEGRLVCVDSPQAMVARVGGRVLDITPSEPGDAACADICARVESVSREQPGLTIETLDGRVRLRGDGIAGLIPALASELGDLAAQISINQPTLEDAYLSLTGRALGR